MFNHRLLRRDKREYFPGNFRVHPAAASAAADRPAETLRADGELASLFEQVEQLFAVSWAARLLPADN